MEIKFQCQRCGRLFPVETLEYKCSCGGLFSIKYTLENTPKSAFTLGEGKTPVIKQKLGPKEVFLKLDFIMPTGSFKDRGAVLMIEKLAQQGIQEIVEDSSGNAGAAAAAYAAQAGIKCNIFLPENTSKKKIKQIKAYGANIIKVKGGRAQTSQAVKKAAEKKYYASHIYNPLFFAGVSALASEIDKKPGAPDMIFVPAGNGTLLLGLFYGFKKLGYLPRLIAVQAKNCAPLYDEKYNLETQNKKTMAEGIAINNPVRKKEMLKAVEESKGDIITVSEKMIKKAQNILNKKGIYIEPTAAAAPAGFLKFVEKHKKNTEGKVVIPLTGTGLKK